MAFCKRKEVVYDFEAVLEVDRTEATEIVHIQLRSLGPLGDTAYVRHLLRFNRYDDLIDHRGDFRLEVGQDLG